jgi:hypothetical protein
LTFACYFFLNRLAFFVLNKGASGNGMTCS